MTEDEQAAGSWKYRAVLVIPLPSGRFAVCGEFSNINGLPFVIVEECDFVTRVKEQMERNLYEPPPRVREVKASPAPKRAASDILLEI